MNHKWIKSTLGHGEAMCKNCFITNREAAVLGKLNTCINTIFVQPKPFIEEGLDPLPAWAEWKGEGSAPLKWWATDPSGERVLVYRSYGDYCDD